MDWKDATDRLPARYCECIVYANNEVMCATFSPSLNILFFDLSGGKIKDVTHWMPLPEPPKDIK